MPDAELDHLVVGCASLDQGATWAEAVLGASPRPGGAHEGLGTHNLLLGFGSGLYLELIAPDPGQPPEAGPRMFGLDDPGLRARLGPAPRLLSFVARSAALDAVLARIGSSGGTVRSMARGGMRWRFAAPTGNPDGLIPALIEWEGGRSAAAMLPDSGLRLRDLRAGAPEPEALRRDYARRGLELPVELARRPVLIAALTRTDGREVTLRSD